MDDWSEDLVRKYIHRRREESRSWKNCEISSRELEFRNRFKTMIGDWIVVDDTANPLEPIGIDEII